MPYFQNFVLANRIYNKFFNDFRYLEVPDVPLSTIFHSMLISLLTTKVKKMRKPKKKCSIIGELATRCLFR